MQLTNAQVALQASVEAHRNGYPSPEEVTRTASKFYEWLEQRTPRPRAQQL